MKGLMRIVEARGAKVSGSDLALGGHSAKNIGNNIELVVFSGAVGEDNVELIEAKRRKISCIERGEFLGQLCKSFDKVIAVAGTHGKTTTSAMLGGVMREATLHFGGQFSTLNFQRSIEDIDGIRLGGDTLITEACEFRRSMLYIKEAVAIITNVDFDHPDCYRDRGEYFKAFKKFAKQSLAVIICGDDRRTRGLVRNKVVITFGFEEGNDYRAVNITESDNGVEFDVVTQYGGVGRIKLNVPGRHNALNALCAVVTALNFGLEFDEVAGRLENFLGVKRRMELIGDLDGREVWLDYAHHPKEIECALSAVGGRKTTVVFQPHTYSRLRSLWEEFGEVLNNKAGHADISRVIVLPVYAAREKALKGVGGREFAEQSGFYYADSFKRARAYLKTECDQDEIILLLGAGDIDKVII